MHGVSSPVGETLDLAPSRLQVGQGGLAEFGNMSSPTILFILDRLRRAGADRPCVALAFEAALLH